ncbi:MAG TPA: adenylate/guanylate cyclase domain-containing protein [Burkholderiales bacterium]
MAGKRLKTVLFAEVSGRDEFVRAAGPVMGWNGISDCVDRLQRTARSSGGRVVKVIGSELMMLFESPDAAAGAASRMHAAVNALPSVSGTRLSVKVGYHAGPVVEGNDDLLGDTVKLVAALLRQAQAGQTLTTHQTAQLLNDQSRSYSGQVYAPSHAAGGNRERPRAMPARSYSGQAHAAPLVAGGTRERPRAQRMLRLSYGSESVTCGLDNEAVVVGRDPTCQLVAATAFASRRHCSILLRPDGFKILDHSSNGTFLTNEGGEEIELLNGQEAPLARRGWVSLGCSRAFAIRLLEFTGH